MHHLDTSWIDLERNAVSLSARGRAGGPAMIRGASKNHNAVTVVTDTKQYAQVIAVRLLLRASRLSVWARLILIYLPSWRIRIYSHLFLLDAHKLSRKSLRSSEPREA
jgi:hypothetical protein